ncbi:MAG TPA: hypothetical protein VN921_01345 [Chthoniobacterales bacterium]|nr:hypothetical protein [Chthoniobacterales bacterium]
MIIAHEDTELLDWLLGIANNKPVRPGDFLRSLAEVALRADHENYPLMRPFLLEMKKKYPEYLFTEADSLAAGERFADGEPKAMNQRCTNWPPEVCAEKKPDV